MGFESFAPCCSSHHLFYVSIKATVIEPFLFTIGNWKLPSILELHTVSLRERESIREREHKREREKLGLNI
jgi:hypothetical protein